MELLITGASAPELRTAYEAVDTTLAGLHRQLQAIDRKRSWRESEKAMAAAGIKQRMVALQALAGGLRTAMERAAPLPPSQSPPELTEDLERAARWLDGTDNGVPVPELHRLALRLRTLKEKLS